MTTNSQKATADRFTIETVGRKAFSRRLQNIMRTDQPAGMIKADRLFEGIWLVEVFDSPEGTIVALHEHKTDREPWLDVVHVVRPASTSETDDSDAGFIEDGDTPTAEPEFVEVTEADERHLEGTQANDNGEKPHVRVKASRG